MNRTIDKFKLWDKKSNNWWDDGFAISENGEILIPDSDDSYKLADQDQFILVHFTGLKDKKGVEIFEGDIVRSRVNAGNDIFENWQNLDEEVYFGGGAFYPVSMVDTEKEYEVIGNIYENPELLKVAEDNQ